MKIFADIGKPPIGDPVVPQQNEHQNITILVQPPSPAISRTNKTIYVILTIIFFLVLIAGIHAGITFYNHGKKSSSQYSDDIYHYSSGECIIVSLVVNTRPNTCNESFDLKCFNTFNTNEVPCGTGLYPNPLMDYEDIPSGEIPAGHPSPRPEPFQHDRSDGSHDRSAHRPRPENPNEPQRSEGLIDSSLRHPEQLRDIHNIHSEEADRESLKNCYQIKVNFTSKDHQFYNTILHADFDQQCTCSFAQCLDGVLPILYQNFDCRFRWNKDNKDDLEIAAGELPKPGGNILRLFRLFGGRFQMIILFGIIILLVWSSYRFCARKKTVVTPTIIQGEPTQHGVQYTNNTAPRI